MELVQEYRTRLVADVVAGKLDVREAAAHLPDEDDEEEWHGQEEQVNGEEGLGRQVRGRLLAGQPFRLRLMRQCLYSADT